MKRRDVLLILGAAAVAPAYAHHGWSSFDQDKPLYLQGSLKNVRWQNPHAEAELTLSSGLKLPADLTTRTVPAQQQTVDGAALLKKAQLPDAANAQGDWSLEFAPLSRMEAWKVQPLKAGDRIEVIGYAGVPGKPRLMRVEYLFVNGEVYGLRSSPAR